MPEGHSEDPLEGGINYSVYETQPSPPNNESAVRELGDDTLKKIALEITEKLRRSTTVDWQKRESVRAVRGVFLAGGSGLCPCLCPFLEYLYCGTPLDRRS